MILPISVQIVLVAMLGGANTVLGPVVGAAILITLSEYTRAWLGYKGTGVDMIVYGALITIISMYLPNGVWGSIATWRGEANERFGAAGRAGRQQILRWVAGQ